MSKVLTRHGWSVWHLVAAAALVLLGVAATWAAWADIYYIATKDEEHSHILLVPIVVAWLVFVRRGRFRHCQPRGTWLGPALVAAGWLLSMYGFRREQSIQSFFHGGAVLVAVGCLLTVVGRDVLVRFLPAFLVLVFLVPIPQRVRLQVAMPMQKASAAVTAEALDLMGVPIDRSENTLTINGHDVAVVEACNGMRMVFALVLVSYAFAFGEPLRNYVRLIILAASPVSAIFCNVLRLVPTVWLNGYASPRVAELFHDAAGYGMLVVAFLFLFLIIRVLEWALIPVKQYTLAAD